MILPIILGVLALAVLALCTLFSLRLTRRPEQDPARSPDELGLDFEEVHFPARDGLRLTGWWIPAASERAVIFLHGHGGSMDPDLQYVPDFQRAGLNVLMFDFRAHGRSEGRAGSVGFLERRDALGAVDFALSRGMRSVGLLGFSMGGAVAMLTAPICPAVGAVVSDGGFARLTSAITGWAAERGIPALVAQPLGAITFLVTSLRIGANLFRYQPLRWVGGIGPRPILFIHGIHDPYLSAEDFAQLLHRAGPSAEMWVDPQAGHREIDQLHPAEYRRRLVDFFDRHLVAE